MTSLLEVENLTKQFGDFVAIDDLSVTVEDGATKALIGPNGAGKTTLYNLITGKLRATSGRMLFKGEDITNAAIDERSRRGLGRSFQITNVFPELTVRKNVRAPIIARSSARYDFVHSVSSRDDLNVESDRILEMVGLDDIAEETCTNLPYGAKRRVELGITLATDPDLVLLDEPTAGMTPEETEEMVELIGQLNEEFDVTFLLTEHDMGAVFSVAERIIVLSQGTIIADGTPSEIQSDERVQSAYLGGQTV